MALLFIDGFDYLGTNPEISAVDKGIWSGATSIAATRETGRDGTGYSFKLAVTGDNMYKDIADQSGNTCIVGFAYYKDDSGAYTDTKIFRVWRNNGRSDEQLALRVTSAGKLAVVRGSTTLATGTTILTKETWYHFEFKFLVHNSTGTYHVKLNGVDEISAASSKDTQNSVTNDSVQCFSMELGAANDWRCDDYYFMNTTGTINTDFLGDVQVKLLLPDTDDTANWTRSAGSVNADLVDDPEDDDGDTTYVHSATATTQDWYNMPNGDSNIDTVFGVQTSIVARKDDATTREVRTEIKAPTTEQNGSTNALTTTYTGYTDMFETKDGTLAWDTTALDALLIGPNVVT